MWPTFTEVLEKLQLLGKKKQNTHKTEVCYCSGFVVASSHLKEGEKGRERKWKGKEVRGGIEGSAVLWGLWEC